jgi:hypothetical protein
MAEQKRMIEKKKFLSLFGILIIVGLAIYVLAVGAQVSPLSRSLNQTTTGEQGARIFNFTINTTYFGTNVTDINISLWNALNYSLQFYSTTTGSNGTGNTSCGSDALCRIDFAQWGTNQNQVLRWNGSLMLLNSTGTSLMTASYFWFNATAMPGTKPGLYNITIRVHYNNSAIALGPGVAYDDINISIKINDTLKPNITRTGTTTDGKFNVTFGATQILSNGTYSGNLVLNASPIDNGYISEVKFNVTWNGTTTSNLTSMYAGANTTTATGDWIYTLDTNQFPDGYNYSITSWVKDADGNLNNSATVWNFTIDNTLPAATFTCSPIDVQRGDVVTCSCTPTDSLSGIDTSLTVYTATPSTSVAGTYTQDCTFADRAGNAGTVTSNSYIVWGSSSSGSSSSSSTTPFAYTNTISQTSQDFSEMKTIQTSSFSGGGLAAKEKVTFKLGSQEHYVGVRTLTASSATVEVASTPTQVSLTVGQESKRDLDNDGFYDISIKLNSITNGKADLTISYLHETVPAGAANPTGTQVPTGETGTETTANNTWIWIVVGAVVLAVLVGSGFVFKKKKRR